MSRENLARRGRHTWVLVAAIALTALAVACGGSGDDQAADTGRVGRTIDVAGGSFARVTPAELQTMLQSKNFPLINVHIPYDGEIEGTDQFIPYDQITQRLSDLPSDKSARIVLYCRSGNMSTAAAEALVKEGYTSLFELGGGMNAWKAAGLPIISKG